MTRRCSAFLCVLALTSTLAAPTDPPKLTAISPQFWAVGVNPNAQKTISATFDQRMRPDSASWLGSDSLAPESFGESTLSPDRQTITLPVTLAPGKVYALCLNEQSKAGIGFQNVRGFPLARHYLVFQTAGTPLPEDMPPRAVSTAPAANAQQVDPTKTTGVTIAFDKPMDPRKHGLQIVENGKPVDLASVRFQYSPDGKTFGLAYEFKPSSTYEVTLNGVQNLGFATTTRIPLWPVRFNFTTAQPQ